MENKKKTERMNSSNSLPDIGGEFANHKGNNKNVAKNNENLKKKLNRKSSIVSFTEEDNSFLDDLNGLVGSIKLIAKGGLKYEDVSCEVDLMKKNDIVESCRLRDESNIPRPLRDIGKIDNEKIDWRVGSFQYLKLLYCCYLLFFINFLNIMTGILWYYVNYALFYKKHVKSWIIYDDEKSQSLLLIIDTYLNGITEVESYYTKFSSHFLKIMLVFNLCHMSLLVMDHILFVNWKKSIGMIFQEQSLFELKSLYKLLEVIVSVIVPLERFESNEFEFRVNFKICHTKINYIFYSIFLLIRIWYIFRFALYSSYYSKSRSQRFCAMYNVEISLFFTFKCILKKYPRFYLILGFSVIILTGGFLIQIWERIGIINPNYLFDNFLNCIWYCFGSMTNIGFGDMVATSLIGRFITFIIVIKGILLVSMLTAILAELFEFSDGDLKAFQNMNEVRDVIKLKDAKSVTVRNLIKSNFFLSKFHKAELADDKINMKKYENLVKFYKAEYMKCLQEQRNIKNDMNFSQKNDYIELFFNKLENIKDEIKQMLFRIDYLRINLDEFNEIKRNLDSLKSILLSREDI